MREFLGISLLVIGALTIAGLILGPWGIFAGVILSVGWFLLN